MVVVTISTLVIHRQFAVTRHPVPRWVSLQRAEQVVCVVLWPPRWLPPRRSVESLRHSIKINFFVLFCLCMPVPFFLTQPRLKITCTVEIELLGALLEEPKKNFLCYPFSPLSFRMGTRALFSPQGLKSQVFDETARRTLFAVCALLAIAFWARDAHVTWASCSPLCSEASVLGGSTKYVWWVWTMPAKRVFCIA